MSEVQKEPSEPSGLRPDQSLMPPSSTASGSAPMPYWAPPPPAPPRPVDNSLWHRLAAGVVLAAVIATVAGAGVGWSLARTINSHNPTAAVTQPITSQPITTQPPNTPQTPTPAATHPIPPQPITTQPQTTPETPLQPANPSTGSLNADAIAAKIDPAVVDINTVVGSSQAAGTGMIISSNGEILTNNHVVDGSTSIQVTIAGHSQPYTAHLIAANPRADIAVIKVDGLTGLPTASFASSSSVNVGDAVVAIGNALGQGGAPSVSQGTIVALDQTITASSG